MAALTATLRAQTGAYNNTINTLSAADTLTYTSGASQQIVLTNPTAAIVTVTLKGSSAATFNVSGYGSVSVAAGLAVSVPASGGSVSLQLDTISQYLVGTSVAVTGGVGATAILFQ